MREDIQPFTELPWINPPHGEPQVYQKRIYSVVEAEHLFDGVKTLGFERRRSHMVFRPDGVNGYVNRRIRDTHDLDGGRAFLEQQGVGRKLWAESMVGVKTLYQTQILRGTTPLQILGYEKGGHFALHADSHIRRDGEWFHNSPERCWSGILWLSDSVSKVEKPNDCVGGALHFPHIGKTIEPTAGTLVLFPSHPRYEHEVFPVLDGYRMALVFFWEVV